MPVSWFDATSAWPLASARAYVALHIVLVFVVAATWTCAQVHRAARGVVAWEYRAARRACTSVRGAAVAAAVACAVVALTVRFPPSLPTAFPADDACDAATATATGAQAVLGASCS